ncbi:MULTISPECIES: type II toxin-antitoxin system RelE/ParE family toxin [unclassified Marinimicrobium]|jgi:plasmid stabilization system protein ParE|uniref:type II toxin-antitoxin system RelE/ParE family toxin n=1 Tax=unclassified Marinimicrobium TaxID=2632100 RepID=UPI0039C8F7D2|tara:strand:+ start:397 stop:591 length:195 start_codon:yes stop_codon:yes gene_type:complete
MKIEWTESAELDLGDIYAYIARDVPIYAEQFIDRIIENTFLLHEQPHYLPGGNRLSVYPRGYTW